MLWALSAMAALATSAPVAARLSSTSGLPLALGAALRSRDAGLVAAAAAAVGNLAAHRASQAVIGGARGLGREVVRSARDARDLATAAATLGEHGSPLWVLSQMRLPVLHALWLVVLMGIYPARHCMMPSCLIYRLVLVDDFSPSVLPNPALLLQAPSATWQPASRAAWSWPGSQAQSPCC